MNIKIVLTDIEGTTTDISFVHKVLFPYSEQHLSRYIEENFDHKDVQRVLHEARKEAGLCDDQIGSAIIKLKEWIKQDKKVTPLKELQGMIWQEGYLSGELKGHLYPDALEYLKKWHTAGKRLYVYSSGSISAQKLLFGYSEYGDLTPLFSGYFDTTTGQKRDPRSYHKIAENIGHAANEILFLSDIPAELIAAKEAGMKTVLLVRGEVPEGAEDFRQAADFSEIDRIFSDF